MKQPVFEVREKKAVLFLGIIFTIIFGAMIWVMLGAEDTDIAGKIFCAVVFGTIALLGLYLVMAYLLHRLQVFADGKVIYSSAMGKKTTFTYKDIAKIEQKYIKTAMSLTLKNAAGKRLATVESNMENYDKLCQWINGQKQIEAEKQGNMELLGVSAGQNVQIEPVKIQGTGKVGRIFLTLFGIIMLIVAAGAFLSLAGGSGNSEPEQIAVWFDTYNEYDGKQMVEFEMISYPFASFELNDSQGLYFVFDEEMCVYIVCMENERLETEFAEIYDYTFSDAVEMPEPGTVEGYAMPIEEDLKALAIEEFNYLWGEEVLTTANFEEYLGNYYLDTTYQPTAEGESPASTVIAGVFCLVLGIYLIYYAVKGYKKAAQKLNEQSGLKQHAEAAGMCGVAVDSMAADVRSSDGSDVIGTDTSAMDETGLNSGVSADIKAASAESAAQVSGAGDLQIPRNIFITLAAVMIGAAAGGVLWILFYKLGRIAAISGYLAVFGAVWGWTKVGRRNLNAGAMVLCVVLGGGMIVFANYLSYAWEIVDAINASNPGRAEFAKVFMNMPQMMTDYELWGSFIADLGMGLGFALIAGIGGLFGKKKK